MGNLYFMNRNLRFTLFTLYCYFRIKVVGNEKKLVLQKLDLVIPINSYLVLCNQYNLLF